MSNFKPGTTVWAKYMQFPWWPSIVVSKDDDEVTEEIIKSKLSDTDVLIKFFGSNDL